MNEELQSELRWLLVDDDEDGRYLLAKLLQKHFPRARLVLTSNAEDALRAVETEEFEAIITDNGLATMSGMDLILELRQRGYGRPVIMVSMNPSLKSAALEAGASAFADASSSEDVVKTMQSVIPSPNER